MKKFKFIYILVCFLILTGCVNFGRIGEDLVTGATRGLEGNDSLFSAIAGSFTKGAVDSINFKKINLELNILIDSIIENVGKKSNKAIVNMIDSVLGEVLQTKLNDIGELTANNVGKIRDELLGSKTLGLLVNIRNNLLGDSTMNSVANLRDILLGDSTSILVSRIVARTVDTLESKYRKFQPTLSEDLKAEQLRLKETITTILWVAGGIIAGLIILCAVINIKRRRYLKLNEVLTYEIHKIPEQKYYDELTGRIRNTAQEKKLEPHLRKILDSQGILGENSWKSTK